MTNKIGDLKEGKIYKAINYGGIYKLEDGELLKYNEERNIWELCSFLYSRFNAMKFEETKMVNTHWQPEANEEMVYLNSRFDPISTIKDNFPNISNEFHPNDLDKLECLALEFKIKSILMNWRRLHDKDKINFRNTDTYSYRITYCTEMQRVEVLGSSIYLEAGFGLFSSEEKAKQFYDYQKEEIDRYFELREYFSY
jgi:hypothetical protein